MRSEKCNDGVGRRLRFVFCPVMGTVAGVSLNRSEQQLFDYVQKHPEELRFWGDKVRAIGASADPHAAAVRLEAELWAYYKERSEVVPNFRAQAAREGLARVSLRNLSEYLLRLWCPPRPRRRAGDAPPREI